MHVDALKARLVLAQGSALCFGVNQLLCALKGLRNPRPFRRKTISARDCPGIAPSGLRAVGAECLGQFTKQQICHFYF